MGYLLYISFDWNQPEGGLQLVRERLARQEAQQYVRRLEETWKLAYANIIKAQESMQRQANKH